LFEFLSETSIIANNSDDFFVWRVQNGFETPTPKLVEGKMGLKRPPRSARPLPSSALLLQPIARRVASADRRPTAKSLQIGHRTSACQRKIATFARRPLGLFFGILAFGLLFSWERFFFLIRQSVYN